MEILNVASFVCDPERDGTNSDGVVIVNFAQRKVLLAGMRYAGEMKKSMFAVQNFLLPEKDVMPMHCSANVCENRRDHPVLRPVRHRQDHPVRRPGNVPDRRRRARLGQGFRVQPRRGLLRQDHRPLSKENEPIIWDAIRFGAIIENVVLDERAPPTTATPA